MRLFLSSTYEDLATHRQLAAQALERLGQQGKRMEVFGARPSEASAVCFDEIAEADALVGLYAHRYGFVPAGSSQSITEQEFDFARRSSKPTFCFVIDNEHPWPPRHIESEPGQSKLKGFKDRIRQQVVTDVFSSPEDLAYKLTAALGRFLLTAKVKTELDHIPGGDRVSTEQGRSQVARRATRLQEVIKGTRVLLVNDVPAEMTHVIELLRGLHVDVHVSTTSEEALQVLKTDERHVVISDMARGAAEDEGIRFLGEMRLRGFRHPVIFTVGRFDPSRGTPGHAFGITNRVDEMLNLLFDALERLNG
jgi:CheY-like chemotaxis protein